MPTLEKIKLVIFGPKPQRTPKYAGVNRQWGWSSEFKYKGRNTSYDNLERQLASQYR